MKITAILLFISFLYFHSLAVPRNSHHRWRVKRGSSNVSKLENFTDSNNAKLTLTSTTTTTTDVSNVDSCNASEDTDTNTERRRRSTFFILQNITTTETPPDTTMNISILSPEFISCAHISLEPQCYEKLQNESVFVPLYNRLYDRSNHIISQSRLFICSDVLNTELQDKFSINFNLVSLICSSISTICIILHIIMFLFVKKLRNLPGYCLLSLCHALLGAYACGFIQFKDATLTQCTIYGMFMLYFFLASFFWMNVIAYDVRKSIKMATAKLQLSTNRPFIVQYARYSLYGWGMPLMIIITSIIIHFSSSEDSKYRLMFNKDTCWFKYKQGLTLYFAGPLITLIVLNILLFISSFYMISSSTMSKPQSKNNKGSSDLWSRLFLSFKLASVMGFMWIIGIIAISTRQEWLWYLYSACSALQGVFIFFSFTVNERTRRICKNILQKRKCSVIPTQSTSQQGTSF